MEQIGRRDIQFNFEAFVTNQLNGLAPRAFLNAVNYPMFFANTLIKLGHDPYPLSMGKRWLFFGDLVYFRPNFFKYLLNVCQSHGYATLYTGFWAYLAYFLVSNLCTSLAKLYMGKHYPEIGGNINDILLQMPDKTLRELNTHQLIRVRVYVAGVEISLYRIFVGVGFSVGLLLLLIIVIMVRQIAQHIGNDAKYLPNDLLQPFLCIGTEEGPAGFFSGIVPELVGLVFVVWGTALVGSVVEHGVRYLERDQDMEDNQTVSLFANIRNCCNMLTSWMLHVWRYPFVVVSTVMAVTGSGLTVSETMPFSPSSTHWTDVYEYLLPYELMRGANLIFRTQRGPVTMGADGKLYSSKTLSI